MILLLLSVSHCCNQIPGSPVGHRTLLHGCILQGRYQSNHGSVIRSNYYKETILVQIRLYFLYYVRRTSEVAAGNKAYENQSGSQQEKEPQCLSFSQQLQDNQYSANLGALPRQLLGGGKQWEATQPGGQW